MKKILIIAILSVFIVAPVLAKFVSDITHSAATAPQTEVSDATKEDITNAVKRKNSLLPDTEKFSDEFKVVEYKKITNWWYIARLEIDGLEQSVILSKFTNNKDSTTAVTLPGVGVPYYNISNGLGIPYEVIDEYNKNWSVDHE